MSALKLALVTILQRQLSTGSSPPGPPPPGTSSALQGGELSSDGESREDFLRSWTSQRFIPRPDPVDFEHGPGNRNLLAVAQVAGVRVRATTKIGYACEGMASAEQLSKREQHELSDDLHRIHPVSVITYTKRSSS